MATSAEIDRQFLLRAICLARQGEGAVEPNPMVGCVIARDSDVIAEGWHRRFGGPHAEIDALQQAGSNARGATMYVSLEPCCHHGKTPPCVEAIIAAGIRRVVVAMVDPFPRVAGGGLAALRSAGIEAEVGHVEAEARRLNAPYLKRLKAGRPWIIAKWAMTLDGHIATVSGESRWISGEASRGVVHRLRGRVDAIIVGSRTAAIDDPMLTARPPGPRMATRIIVDSACRLSPQSYLARTAREVPVLVATSARADVQSRRQLEEVGCEVLVLQGATHAARLGELLNELGRREMTNVLVEGGAALLGTLFELQAIDEVHAFIAPKLIGGAASPTPIGGAGISEMAAALRIEHLEVERCENDIYAHGIVVRPPE